MCWQPLPVNPATTYAGKRKSTSHFSDEWCFCFLREDGALAFSVPGLGVIGGIAGSYRSNIGIAQRVEVGAELDAGEQRRGRIHRCLQSADAALDAWA